MLPEMTATDRAIYTLEKTIEELRLRIDELEATRPQVEVSRRKVKFIDPRKIRRERR